jgi:hypothetical protein
LFFISLEPSWRDPLVPLHYSCFFIDPCLYIVTSLSSLRPLVPLTHLFVSTDLVLISWASYQGPLFLDRPCLQLHFRKPFLILSLVLLLDSLVFHQTSLFHCTLFSLHLLFIASSLVLSDFVWDRPLFMTLFLIALCSFLLWLFGTFCFHFQTFLFLYCTPLFFTLIYCSLHSLFLYDVHCTLFHINLFVLWISFVLSLHLCSLIGTLFLWHGVSLHFVSWCLFLFLSRTLFLHVEIEPSFNSLPSYRTSCLYTLFSLLHLCSLILPRSRTIVLTYLVLFTLFHVLFALTHLLSLIAPLCFTPLFFIAPLFHTALPLFLLHLCFHCTFVSFILFSLHFLLFSRLLVLMTLVHQTSCSSLWPCSSVTHCSSLTPSCSLYQTLFDCIP